MTAVKTQIWLEPWDISRRINELGLRLDLLHNIVRQVIEAGEQATLHHAANAEGTYRYQEGVYALRKAFVGDKWEISRENSVETIKNDKLKIKVAFTNVDLACNHEHDPQPRSKKGEGAEKTCSGNTPLLPNETWAKYARPENGEWKTFYLMVDREGAAELSQPVVSEETFKSFIERIFLTDSAEYRHTSSGDDGTAVVFDPQISRK
ncbi:MAG: hypothetical protein OXC63_11510 [Aestuariivita sp.]|nr:hypothetical protein [Aestuariivita sp.]